MNRSMLIIITDFLLLSLITFAKFDQIQTREETKAPPASGLNPASGSGANKDLIDVLKLSLEEERASRERLSSRLNSVEETVRAREGTLAETQKRVAESQRKLSEAERRNLESEQKIAESQQRITETQQTLRKKEEESRALEKGRQALQEQLQNAQSTLGNLTQQLAQTVTTAKTTAVRADTLEADLKSTKEEAERLRRQLDDLEKKRLASEGDRQKLSAQLQVAEVEKKLTREQLDATRKEVQTVRTEKAKLQEQITPLAQGVSALAEKSGELTKEIRENRPLAPNLIFSEFRTNRVETSFKGGRTGAFGQAVTKEKQTKTILVSDGPQTYAIYHLDDTPLSFTTPGMEWRQLTGTLRRERASVPVSRVLFLDSDPRVVLVPLKPADAAKLAAKVYPVTKNPFKFQDAMLVGADEGYYGECKFQLDPELPQYVRMHHGIFSRLVGNFAPSTGDLVLSKTGELLGVMVNKSYCLVLASLKATQGLPTGEDLITTQPTGKLLSQLHTRVVQFPYKLQ